LLHCAVMIVAAASPLLSSYLAILDIKDDVGRVKYMAAYSLQDVWQQEIISIFSKAADKGVLRQLDLHIQDMENESDNLLSSQTVRAELFLDLLIATSSAHAWSAKLTSTM
jgi:hypothetical protein